MTALEGETLPVQARETFTCPRWCTAVHDREALHAWDDGQWTVHHEGEEIAWPTSRGTEMTARLVWTEIVGSRPIVVEGWTDFDPVRIELGGDDGSGYMGTHEVMPSDWPEWQRVLTALWEKAKS
ncbi:hypothetical protein [Aeromicrobium sp. Leaf245]|uniref:DUF6907 domain-containing protein n=1 Tax=Aeromicrobium sp. Leaf245 TaxID=1736306 RepID=UPI0006FF5FA8|nr:hypothetical protein [Aeromicrobium sp. Leaf245]KQO41860.1 hypothetical protein ASF05_12215 [Aeromicrobium sp. Leaf245]